jgi:hypothetical protein
MRVSTSAILAVIMAAPGCGGGISSVWKGSGEVGEGRFFTLKLDTRDMKKPSAMVGFEGVTETPLAVCSLRDLGEGRMEFQMDPDSRAAACDAMRNPLKFSGDMGGDVLAGKVVDGAGRQVGMFRAFRVED